MTDQPVTLYNCKPGDVFEMSRVQVRQFLNREAFLGGIYTFSWGLIYSGQLSHIGERIAEKQLKFAAYDLERDVYTVECR